MRVVNRLRIRKTKKAEEKAKKNDFWNAGDDVPPREIQEGLNLMASFYGFDRTGDPDRYIQAESFRMDVYRLIVLQFHLSIEELLKSLIYEALPTDRVFTADQNIKYLQDLNSRSAIDLAARLGLVNNQGYDVLLKLNSTRNKMAHNWTAHSYELRRKTRSGQREGSPAIEFNGKDLLQPEVMKDDFIPLYADVYLEFFAARYGIEWEPKYITFWPQVDDES